MAPAHDTFSPPETRELMQKLPRDRGSGFDRESYRDRGREREISRDKDIDSSRARGRVRESSRDWDRGRESSRDRGRESSRDRGRESSRDRGVERDTFRDVARDRPVGSRASDGGIEEIRQFSGDRSRRSNANDAADLRRHDDYDDEIRRPVVRDRGRGYDDGDLRPTSRDRGREYDDERRPMRRDSDDRCEDVERRPVGGGRGRGWGGRGRGGDRDDDTPIAPPLYCVLKATVHSIRPFGIFVQMEGYRNHGLVHLSQVSDHEVTNRDDSEEVKVKALSSVAGEGEQVWVKVISVNVEENGKPKIGCSMKYVRQGDGEDLDPNNIQAEKQQSRPAWKEPQKFQLEAVLNVKCERCGGHGHLKKECYSSGEKTYKLLSDEDDEDADLTIQECSKSEHRLPRQSSKRLQPPIGMSKHLLATGSVGRGRAVVQPAWMKHGIGVGGPAPPETGREPRPISALPEKLESVEDALAVIALLKDEKHRRKEEGSHRNKEKRSKSRDEKHKSKREDRHKSRDEKDKRKKRKLRDEEDRKERHSSRKKHREKSSS